MADHRTAPLVLPLSELDADSLPLVGGKAAHLGEMLRAGLPVPDGFAVTTIAYARRDSVEVREAICAGYRTLGGKVAVRSSATAEDLPEASFAGQQDTFLNIEGEDAVLNAVERCWTSLFSERAVAYRQEHGLSEENIAMAVVVQRMVDADCAGVLFTMNPVSGAADELVIEAAPGLGDKVVSAQVTPDLYRLRRRSPHEIIEQQGSETAPWITPAILADLARLGLAAERLLGRAADVEWAVASGRVYLLQARAVTATPRF